VDVRDIARVAVRVLTTDISSNEHYNKAYNITGPEALSYQDAAEILSNETGKKISYINTSEDQCRKRMKDMGINDWFINTTIELYDFSMSGNLSGVSSSVEEITGKKPISFSQFVRDYAQAFKQLQSVAIISTI
jgi:nucleoside-diphosphate-sugar epimerase